MSNRSKWDNARRIEAASKPSSTHYHRAKDYKAAATIMRYGHCPEPSKGWWKGMCEGEPNQKP